ncbi:MAG: hypothetical protein NVS4B2_15370 [Chloroflexota bacterium]
MLEVTCAPCEIKRNGDGRRRTDRRSDIGPRFAEPFEEYVTSKRHSEKDEWAPRMLSSDAPHD